MGFPVRPAAGVPDDCSQCRLRAVMGRTTASTCEAFMVRRHKEPGSIRLPSPNEPSRNADCDCHMWGEAIQMRFMNFRCPSSKTIAGPNAFTLD
jgi:hypothetical protein